MKFTQKLQTTFQVLISCLLCSLPIVGIVGHAQAAVTNPTAAAKVSFTFDDGLASSLTQAAPTLAKYGYSGTNYVITNCVGMATIPNTCKANTDASYLTWDQITTLKATYGWELGSHTNTHPYMASTDPVDQPIALTQDQVVSELVTSKAALASHGIDAKSYASPYGDYNASTLAHIAKYYESQRGFADLGYNAWPYSEYLLRVQQVQGTVSVATVKSYIDSAVANKQWLILVFHDIKTKASNNNDDYEYSTAKLDQIAAYAKLKGVAAPTVSNALVKGDVNLLANGNFASGLTNWSSDSTTVFAPNNLNNGSYPEPTNSIKVTAGSAKGHLFSAKVPVTYSSNYLIKNYSNMTALASGEIGYYIDEYDANGVWISGQFKASQRSVFVDAINFAYSPTSSQVTSARLQIGVAANSGISAYIDTAQWFTVTSVVPPVSPTNLLTNSSFDSGLTGWSTDKPSAILLDTASHGSPENIINSVSLAASTTNGHLFSNLVVIEAGKTYSLSSYLNITQNLSGEIGYYIDEYDANGAWISGQFKKSVTSVGVSSVSFSYIPSSINVKKARLQVIVTANSGVAAYFDNATWTAN